VSDGYKEMAMSREHWDAKREAELATLKARLAEARRVCDEQANDEGLWFVAVTVTEDYLQAALRRLHAAVEGTASQPRPLTAAERSALDRAFARSITVLDPGIDATGDQEDER